MSQESFYSYIQTEYEGFVITTNPSITRNTDQQITDFKDSLAGKFTIGETITGSISGATGTLVQKNIDLNQLVIQNVSGSFLGDPNAITNSTENITGATSTDTVASYIVYKYADACLIYTSDAADE